MIVIMINITVNTYAIALSGNDDNEDIMGINNDEKEDNE